MSSGTTTRCAKVPLPMCSRLTNPKTASPTAWRVTPSPTESTTPAQAGEFMTDLWNWYCGQLDTELAGYVVGLRPRYRTGILSNSLDGARREEEARFDFQQLVDVVDSHEIGVAKPDPGAYRALCDQLGVAPEDLIFLDNREANVAAARRLGIHGLLHVSTRESITAIDSLLG